MTRKVTQTGPSLENPASNHGAKRQPPASLESGLGFSVGRAHRALREQWERRIADLGLSPAQASVLRAVCEWPGLGLRELAQRTRTDPMNIKHLADRLEEAGLVRSTTDPSHRQRRGLHPTGNGVALAEQLAKRAVAWDRHLSRLLGATAFQQLHLLLDQLRQILDAQPRATPRSTGGAGGDNQAPVLATSVHRPGAAHPLRRGRP